MGFYEEQFDAIRENFAHHQSMLMDIEGTVVVPSGIMRSLICLFYDIDTAQNDEGDYTTHITVKKEWSHIGLDPTFQTTMRKFNIEKFNLEEEDLRVRISEYMSIESFTEADFLQDILIEIINEAA